jgi:hypothetical protein
MTRDQLIDLLKLLPADAKLVDVMTGAETPHHLSFTLDCRDPLTYAAFRARLVEAHGDGLTFEPPHS